MAGEEDDYMGDLSHFLPPETSDSSRTKKRRTEEHPQKPTQRNLSWQQKRKISREQQQREEDEKTLALAQTALKPSNIGFRMLQQMGYKPGSALGKQGQGQFEPVGLEIRRSRIGIGAQTPAEARANRERARKDRLRGTEEGLASEFGSRQKSAWRVRKVAADYKKAEAALAQLENAEVVAPPPPEDDNEEGKDEEVITEEDLQELLSKLRDKHFYCLYCGCQYESMETLLSNCPGDEDDH
ncbi:G patch domain-containing protein 11 [Nymphaea thermarum]|nr:G patch domain-containing protein 11 [Nymphaea thermarum]